MNEKSKNVVTITLFPNEEGALTLIIVWIVLNRADTHVNFFWRG